MFIIKDHAQHLKIGECFLILTDIEHCFFHIQCLYYIYNMHLNVD